MGPISKLTARLSLHIVPSTTGNAMGVDARLHTHQRAPDVFALSKLPVCTLETLKQGETLEHGAMADADKRASICLSGYDWGHHMTLCTTRKQREEPVRVGRG